MESRIMNTIDALYLIKHNPFKYSGYIASFYETLHISDNNLLLLPLIIPLCTHPIFNKKIENSKKNSSMYTIFYSNYEELYNLQERIIFFKTLSSDSLKYCLLNEWLEIDNKKLSCYKKENIKSDKNNKIKVAAKLAGLFNSHSIIEIYTMLGVSL